MTGLFSLKTAADLREKLRRDYKKLLANPKDSDVIFNFFVTAEHMVDWVCRETGEPMKRFRQSSPILQVCSQIANGAKHFEIDPTRHNSISSTGQSINMFPEAMFPRIAFPAAVFPKGDYFLNLDGEAANQLGTTISLVSFASLLMEYWNNHPLT